MLISGARCSGSSQCNLSQFCVDRAERSHRVGLRPNALAFRGNCPPDIHQNLYQSGSLGDPHRAQSFMRAQSGRKSQTAVCSPPRHSTHGNGISATGGSAPRSTSRLSLEKTATHGVHGSLLRPPEKALPVLYFSGLFFFTSMRPYNGAFTFCCGCDGAVPC